MTTFLARNGINLAIAAVTAPLVSYGLHRMVPAPDVRFIAVASTLNLFAVISIRDWAQGMANKLAGKLIQKPENMTLYKGTYDIAISTVTRSLYNTFYITIGTLLPIFWRLMGQRMGILVPNYITTLGCICLATNVHSIITYSIKVLHTYRSYNPGEI